MARVIDIYRCLDGKAPFELQMSFDNSGFLVGRGDREVQRVMVALDITEAVVEEAAEKDCQLIVSHHPIIFHPAKSITDKEPVGRCLLSLVEHGIAAICAHTNLDAVAGGVNDALARVLGLEKVKLLREEGVDANGQAYGIGRMGEVSGFSDAASFARFVKQTLKVSGLRLEDAGRPVRQVAVGGGACGDLLEMVAALGCDTFVTSDVKYNVFLDARAMGVNLIDAGHFSTENVVCPVLAQWITEGFPELKVFLSTEHREIFTGI